MKNKANKRLSQHFLTNEIVLDDIENLIPDMNNNSVIEIGPGRGALTNIILKKTPKQLILIEKDAKLIEILSEKYESSFVKIINNDIRNIDFDCDTVIGAIPYSITRDIIKKTIVSAAVKQVYVIVQKEFADKLINKNIVPISLFANTFFEIEKLLHIDKSAFSPIPAVDSSFLYLKRKDSRIKEFIKYWEFLVKLSGEKRKKVNTIFNNGNNKRIMHLTIKEIEELYVDINIHTH